MSEKTRKYLVYTCLGVAIIWAAFNYEPSKKIMANDNNLSVPQNEIIMQTQTITLSQVEIDRLRTSRWGADPFRAPISGQLYTPSKGTGFGPLHLSGIVYRDNGSMAIINNRAVGVGDKIDGARIIRIERKKVTVVINGRRKSLTVAKGL